MKGPSRASAGESSPTALRASGAQVEFDLSAPGVICDPFPVYEVLRERGPVQYLPHQGFWLVLGYDEMRSVFARPELFSNKPYERVDAVLMAADPPRHGPVRRIIARCFSSATLNRVTARARLEASLLISDEFDAVSEFAEPVARAAAAELIGLDEEGTASILKSAGGRTALAPLEGMIRALDEVAPRAALYDTLLQEGEGLLGPAEAASLIRFLWLASTTTTERVIARSVLRLLQEPATRASLLADEALVAPFLEEIMRLHSPEHMVARVTTAEVELGGAVLPAGAVVQLCFSAANRDPAKFDDPATLRLDRKPNPHLAFGSGPHVCSGAALSRRMLPEVMRTFLRSAPGFTAAEPLNRIAYHERVLTLTPARLLIRR